MVTIKRKTIEYIIASREECGAVNGGLNVGKYVGNENDISNCESDDIKDCGKTNVGVNVGVNDENVGVNVGVNDKSGIVNNMEIMNFSKRQLIIKEIINQNPMITAKQMSETLSVTKRTIERDLSILQKAGVIRHEGSDKSGIWVVLEPYNSKE